MKKVYYRYIVAVAAFVIWFIAWGTYNTFSIFLKPISIDTGWERADLALAYSLSCLIQSFCALGMGRLTDKLGPRIIVAFFGSFIAISFLMLAKITTLWQFQLTYAIICAIGISVGTVPIMATIARWFTAKRGVVTGIVQCGEGIGGLVFALLTGWLILNFDWQTAYFVLGIVALPTIVFFGLLLKKGPEEEMNDQDKRISKEKEKGSEMQNRGMSFKEAVMTTQFWMIAGMFFSYGFCRSTFMVHTAAYVQDKGFSLTDGSNVIAALTFSSILGRVGIGFLGDKIGNRKAFILSYLIMTGALLWGKYCCNLPGLFLFAVAFGFSWGGQSVLRFTFTAETFGLSALGVITGTLGLMEALSGALGSYLAGYAFDLSGSYQIMFTAAITISIMGSLLSYTIKFIPKIAVTVSNEK